MNRNSTSNFIACLIESDVVVPLAKQLNPLISDGNESKQSDAKSRRAQFKASKATTVIMEAEEEEKDEGPKGI